jgi:hypothetical protein
VSLDFIISSNLTANSALEYRDHCGQKTHHKLLIGLIGFVRWNRFTMQYFKGTSDSIGLFEFDKAKTLQFPICRSIPCE